MSIHHKYVFSSPTQWDNFHQVSAMFYLFFAGCYYCVLRIGNWWVSYVWNHLFIDVKFKNFVNYWRDPYRAVVFFGECFSSINYLIGNIRLIILTLIPSWPIEDVIRRFSNFNCCVLLFVISSILKSGVFLSICIASSCPSLDFEQYYESNYIYLKSFSSRHSWCL